jgi:hypothetical protein
LSCCNRHLSCYFHHYSIFFIFIIHLFFLSFFLSFFLLSFGVLRCCCARVRLSKHPTIPDVTFFFFLSFFEFISLLYGVVLSLHSSSSFRCYVGGCRVLNDAMHIISRGVIP